MPISSFMGLQTSLRGLIAHQQALNTTGHNLANANVRGYSRQEVMMSAMPALGIPVISSITGNGAQLGTGVDIAGVRRIRDSFLDLQYRSQAMQLGNAAARTRSLEQAELAFGEPSDDGINAILDDFWGAWQDLTKATGDKGAAKTAVIEAGNTLATAFQAVYAQLTTVATQAQRKYDDIVGPSGDVDTWARELSALNEAIAHAVAVGQTPNDLLDRRDLLVDNLSSLSQVTVTDLRDGTVRVEFGGVTLVDPAAPGGYTWPQTLTSTEGELGALRNLAGPTGYALTYRARLDAVAADLVARVNAIHSNPSGINFFDPAGTSADRIAVVATDATVQVGTTPEEGRVDIANAIAALQGGSTSTLYKKLVAEVGSDVKADRATEAIRQSLVDGIDDRRQAVQGVSPDEEMSNMIRFQRGYEASARVMSTLDDMLDTLINRTGKVGL